MNTLRRPVPNGRHTKQLSFNGSRVTSDGSSVLVRELDERLALGRLSKQRLRTPAVGRIRRFSFAGAQETGEKLAKFLKASSSQVLRFHLLGSSSLGHPSGIMDMLAAVRRGHLGLNLEVLDLYTFFALFRTS